MNLNDVNICNLNHAKPYQFSVWSHTPLDDFLDTVQLYAHKTAKKLGLTVNQLPQQSESGSYKLLLTHPSDENVQIQSTIHPSGSKSIPWTTFDGEQRTQQRYFANVHFLSRGEYSPIHFANTMTSHDMESFVSQFYTSFRKEATAKVRPQEKKKESLFELVGETLVDSVGLYDHSAIQGIRQSNNNVHITTVQKPLCIQPVFENLAQAYLASEGFELEKSKSRSETDGDYYTVYMLTKFGLIPQIERTDKTQTKLDASFEPLPFDDTNLPPQPKNNLKTVYDSLSRAKIGFVRSKYEQIEGGAIDYSISFIMSTRHAKNVGSYLKIPQSTMQNSPLKKANLQKHLSESFATYVRDHQGVFEKPVVVDTSAPVDDLPF